VMFRLRQDEGCHRTPKVLQQELQPVSHIVHPDDHTCDEKGD
jgi:hypothetical protein